MDMSMSYHRVQSWHDAAMMPVGQAYAENPENLYATGQIGVARVGNVLVSACLGQVSVGMEAWQRVLQSDQGFIEGGLDKQPSQSEQNTSPR